VSPYQPTEHSSPARLSATVAVFDIVRSRELAPDQRDTLQRQVAELLVRWNATYDDALLAGFMISLGDECQGLLATPSVLPALMWDLEDSIPDVGFRWGIGYGEIHTQLDPTVTAMDGPAFHNARHAIETAKDDNRRGGVYVGFPEPLGAALNGLARLLNHQRSRMTDAQREAITMMRAGTSVAEAARTLGITRQALEQRTQGGGWSAYEEGESALRALLASVATQHDTTRVAADAR
jgi:hypothetical protein